MDSPHLQSSPQLQRFRTNSNLSVHSATNPYGVRKRSTSRSPSFSALQADRLHSLALDEAPTQADHQPFGPTSAGFHWITPQHSPQPQLFSESTTLEPFPHWTVPTPPRSDSGAPSISVDSNDETATSRVSSSHNFGFNTATSSADMSSLGFLLPSQYGNGLYESESNSYNMDQNYIPSMRSQPTSTGPGSYGQILSSSPALYQSRPVPSSHRRYSEMPTANSADLSYASGRRISSPYESSTGSDYTMATGQTIPSISGLTSSPQPSPYIDSMSSAGSMPPQYSSSLSRSSSSYDSTMYGPPMTTTPSATQLYGASHSMTYPPPFVGSSVNEVLAKPLGSDSSIRVLNQRPKPQCWEHGCNGRQFSTFSNLLRHQREKSGTASKSYCPKCGAEFTRTTARNGHLAHDKCSKNQSRRSSDDKSE